MFLLTIDILTKYLVIFVLRESLSIFFTFSPSFFVLELSKDKEERFVDRCLFL